MRGISKLLFLETALKGAYLIDLEPRVDPRGLFARTYCVEEFKAHGLNVFVAQCNLSLN
ncbi:MAG: dTDP-4-dehydrorhamnose 3,5-epimerase family protein, partial [Gammaproteobacteria bacterium]